MLWEAFCLVFFGFQVNSLAPLRQVSPLGYWRWELYRVLQSAGVDMTGYSGHSFCIGAETTAAKMGLSDSLIQTLGR